MTATQAALEQRTAVLLVIQVAVWAATGRCDALRSL